MKSLLLALLLPFTALGQSSKQIKETRIPLALLPSAVDSSGNDAPYVKLHKQVDTLKRRVCIAEKRTSIIELQQAATVKAICDYKPTGGGISAVELCILIQRTMRTVIEEQAQKEKL